MHNKLCHSQVTLAPFLCKPSDPQWPIIRTKSHFNKNYAETKKLLIIQIFASIFLAASLPFGPLFAFCRCVVVLSISFFFPFDAVVAWNLWWKSRRSFGKVSKRRRCCTGNCESVCTWCTMMWLRQHCQQIK